MRRKLRIHIIYYSKTRKYKDSKNIFNSVLKRAEIESNDFTERYVERM